MAETIISFVGNVTIVQDGNKYGLKDKSNTLIVPIQYDNIEEWPIVEGRNILKVVDCGLIGFYDAITADWICYCTLSRIDKYDNVKNIIIGRQPLKVFGFKLWDICTEVELNEK